MTLFTIAAMPKEYIRLHLELAIIRECDKLLVEEIAKLPPGKMRRRMWKAFNEIPCYISNGSSEVLVGLGELEG
jgi:hypothetical protein